MNLSEMIAAARSVDGRPFHTLDVRFGSLGEMLATRSAEAPHKTWLVYYDEDGSRVEFTYGAFAELVRRAAGYLLRVGIGRGDRVATMGYNHYETVIQYFAAWWIGATVVPLNVGEDDERLAYILANSNVRLLFARSAFLTRAADLKRDLPTLERIVVCGEELEGYDSFLSALASTESLPDFTPDLRDAECLIVYTSGTTGNPKGVLLAHGNLLADADGIASWHRIDAETRMMCVLPIHHVNGTVVTLVTPLYAGASVVLNRKFQSGAFFERVALEGVAIVSVVPTLLAFLVQADIDTSAIDLSAFRHIICGAGPLTCELAERFETRYEVPIVHGYGLSETTCYSCFLPVDLSREERLEWLTKHGFPSIGVPIPQNEMAIHDADGNAVPPGQRGEIVIRGHNVMLEYYGNVAANESAFTHGWFRSGDEGFQLADSDGTPYFFITGRIKELIIRGGVNISPLEIDEVINAHPKVDAGIAVGFENNWYGEEVGAYVRPSDSSLTEEELLAFCRERLPSFKAPKVVVFGDEIPVTSTGKYQRNRVKSLFEAYRDIQYQSRERAKM
jgi:acyl-CoA synthetase (AMP-forming)/AMP-acid ligase II